MRRLVRFVCVAVLAGLVFPGAAQAQTTLDVGTSKAFVQDLGARVVKTLERSDLSKSLLRKEFRQILGQRFDMDVIGRFVLGPYWRQATPAQQKEYMRLFQEMIVELYADRFINYSGEKFDVLNARPEGTRDYLVTSNIVRPSGPPVAVGWRLRNSSGNPKIVDVIVEGVSMGATQRADFAAVVQKTGSIDGLLKTLRDRIKKFNDSSSTAQHQKR